jgi:hypothetical protein
MIQDDAAPPEDSAGHSDSDATGHSGLMGRTEDAAVIGAAAIIVEIVRLIN